MKTYSLKKGIAKGLVSVLSIAGAVIVFAGFGDVSIWDLITKYVQPFLGSLTVGAVITIAINYIKINFLS